jgi:hypothetical protein
VNVEIPVKDTTILFLKISSFGVSECRDSGLGAVSTVTSMLTSGVSHESAVPIGVA